MNSAHAQAPTWPCAYGVDEEFSHRGVIGRILSCRDLHVSAAVPPSIAQTRFYKKERPLGENTGGGNALMGHISEIT
jgi:hypothetical protein